MEFAPDFTIRNNCIHHDLGNSSSSIAAGRGGGYLGSSAHNTTFDTNESAYNGSEQKVVQSTNVTFRNNFVHHNVRDGIWYDTNPNAGALVEGNRVEDNGRNGIFFEASIGATISNNTLRRHPWDAVIDSSTIVARIGEAPGVEQSLGTLVWVYSAVTAPTALSSYAASLSPKHWRYNT